MTTTPEKPMDLAQVTQRLGWLDEERRRDHAELARLAQEMTSVMAILKDQAAKVRESGERTRALEATIANLPRLEDAITATRSELVPLRDADVRLEDELQRQGKDSRSQADQNARLLSVLSGRLDALAKEAESLSHRIQALDAQRKDNADRVSQLAARSDTLSATAVSLADRLHLLDTQRKSQTDRVTEIATRLDALGRAAESLAARLQLLETREHDRVSRDSAIQAQLARLEATQGQSLEDVKRSVARAEAIVLDIQQMRREIVLAQDEEAKRRKADIASMSELNEALATAQRQIGEIIEAQEDNAKWRKEHAAILAEQKEAAALALRQIEEILEGNKATNVRLERLEELPNVATALAGRLGVAEEQLGVLQATYKGLQEVEDTHWNTDIPEILRQVEESSATSASNAVTVQELVASSQALKEAVRELQANLVSEHAYSDQLAAALRGLIEEDLQARLATTQKQLQALRRLTNAPVENVETHE